MATRQSDSMKLVKRCAALEPLGWRVEAAGSEQRVINPRGEAHTVHMTYSDVRSLTNVTKDVENRMGLLQDEAEMKRRRLEDRRNKLKEDREAAERRTELIISTRQGMITKAAGPYLTEVDEPDIDWLTKEHPSPWVRWMYITPKVAAYILEHHNTDNRAKSDSSVDRYKLIILSGQWHMTHQGLAFDTRGLLQDGQHRLYSVLAAGDTDPEIKVPFAVFVGMPQENFKAIDEGRLRSAAQMLKKEGIVGGTHLVTALRLVIAYDSENPRGANRRGKLSTVEAFALQEKDPEGFAEAVRLGIRGYRRTQISPGIMTGAYYLIRRVNGWNNQYVTAFFEGIIAQRKHNTNLILPDDDPRAVLLRRFANGRPRTPIDGLLWIITAWNNMVKGHHPHYMRVGDDTDLPTVLMCLPGEGVVPRALDGELDGELAA